MDSYPNRMKRWHKKDLRICGDFLITLHRKSNDANIVISARTLNRQLPLTESPVMLAQYKPITQ